MDVLHCQTEDGVLKELTVYAIVNNLVRVVMLNATRRQGVPLNRISFVDALRWLSSSPPGTPLSELVVNPGRPGRAEPRCNRLSRKFCLDFSIFERGVRLAFIWTQPSEHLMD